MNRLAFDYANPICPAKVGVRSDHYPFCSKDCQRSCTPHNSNRVAPHTKLSILAPRATVQRKFGTDRKVKTE